MYWLFPLYGFCTEMVERFCVAANLSYVSLQGARLNCCALFVSMWEEKFMTRGFTMPMFVAAIGAVLVGVILWETLHILMALFCLPLFGLQCDELTKWVFGFKRINGKLCKADLPFAAFVKYVPTVNERAKKEVDIDKAHIKFMLFRIAVKIILTVIIIIMINPDWSMIGNAAASMGDTFKIFFCIISFGAILNDVIMLVKLGMTRTNGLGSYIQQIKAALKNGADFQQLQLRPLEELLFEEAPSENEITVYLTYYCTYLLALGRTDEMNIPIHQITDLLRKGIFNQNCGAAYLMLIYYYSWIEHDEEYAKKFYEKAGSELATDTGANAKRVLAYYAYGIQHDLQKASFFLDKAKAAIGRYMPSEAENKLERRLIDELDVILGNERLK